ncbi:MAG: PorP/SprF family type IX secretion system membrane protein [Thermaurantimonas sp.]|uniref:PorP/SprF family type IX secretion system membrane protein n=1 Tax=Thermaurantimonas sp. TaxID=2681568 RepID=UPI003919FE83
MKTLLPILLALIALLPAKAQDPVFSQMLLNKNYINPAYAGYTGDISFDLQSRVQWLRIPAYFLTNAFSFHGGCNATRLGYSITGMHDMRGEGFLQNTRINGAVSVNIPAYSSRRLRPRWLRDKKLIWSTGLNIGVGQRYLNWDRLTFTDQYDIYFGFVRPQSLVQPQNVASNIIIDLSAGTRARMQLGDAGSYASAGFAIWHLNRPVESFFFTDNRLPMRYTGHAFFHWQTERYTNSPRYLSIGWIGNYQLEMQTNVVMAYRDFGLGYMLGAGYRSERIYALTRRVDSWVFQIHVRQEPFYLSYSFDLTMSSLGPHRTFGTHEFGISYLLKGYNMCTGAFRRSRRKKADCFYLNDDLYGKLGFTGYHM